MKNRYCEVNLSNCIDKVFNRFLDNVNIIKVLKKPSHITWMNGDRIEIYLNQNYKHDNFIYTLLNYEYELMYDFSFGCYVGLTDNKKHMDFLNKYLGIKNITVESITFDYKAQ